MLKNRENNLTYWLIGLFVVSRIVLFSIGVRFDSNTLVTFIEIIDPVLLKEHLLQSLFYLHVQPPLYNLFLGIILKIFPGQYPLVFQIIYLVVGLSFNLVLYALMLRLHVHRTIAFGITVLFMISPATILFENWLYISYVTGFLLCAGALLLHKYLQDHRRVHGLGFCLVLMSLVLMRATYHLAWIVFIVLMVLFFDKNFRRTFFKWAVIPILICLSLYVKNYFLTGVFTTSSMLGYHLGTMVFPALTLTEAQHLVDTKMVRRSTFKEVSYLGRVGMYAYETEQLPKTGIPVLDNFRNSEGLPNFNSIYHLRACKQYLEDALYVMRIYPQHYFAQYKLSYFVYFFPGPTDVPFKNRDVISGYENAFNVMFAYLNGLNGGELYVKHLWRAEYLSELKMDGLARFLYALVVGTFAVLVLFGGIKTIKAGRDPAALPQLLTLLYMLFNIFFVTAVSCGVSPDGGNRFRFDVDPFYCCLLGMLATELFTKFRRTQKTLRA